MAKASDFYNKVIDLVFPTIDPDTGNWVVGTNDTGVEARGPQGPAGPGTGDGLTEDEVITIIEDNALGQTDVEDIVIGEINTRGFETISEVDRKISEVEALPNPTQPASILQNVNGAFVEVVKKRVNFTGADMTLNDGDTSRVITIPDNALLESDGYILDVDVRGQRRFVDFDYTVVSNTQIQLDFPTRDIDVIHITYTTLA